MARPKEFDRDQALLRAVSFFADRGYDGASTEALLDEMGVSRQSLYDTFGSKHDLYLEALRRYNRDSAAEFAASLGSASSAFQGLQRTLDVIIDRGVRVRKGACLGVGSICEFGLRDDEVAEALREAVPLFMEPLVRALIRAQADGDISAELDPRLAADFLLTLLNGLKVNSRAGMPIKRLKELGRMALDGLKAR